MLTYMYGKMRFCCNIVCPYFKAGHSQFFLKSIRNKTTNNSKASKSIEEKPKLKGKRLVSADKRVSSIIKGWKAAANHPKYGMNPLLLKVHSKNVFNKTTKNSKPLKNTEAKPKITAIRRLISADKQHSTIIEGKTAADAIKRLNWENNKLFGPILSSQPVKYDGKKISETNEILQHSTQIPASESVNAHSGFTKELNQRKELPNLEGILSFPLVNKSTFSRNDLQKRINELNLLRKYLETLANASVPSVSYILEKTMPSESVENLNHWKQKMINELGEKGFREHHKNLLTSGASLHRCIGSFLASTPEIELQIKKENIGYWKSLQHVFSCISDVKLLEEIVTHPFLCYKGVVKCFAKYKNNLVVIDWKTSNAKLNLKSTHDNPLQIAAYVGALNFDPKYQYLASKGLIVVAYEDGMPATVHFMEESAVKQHWNEWLQRVKQYWEMKRSEEEKF